MEPVSDASQFRPPKQSRSQRTLDRMAEAALAIMEEEGVEGATVSAIVKRARASVGSFYARFPGKEDLVRYLRSRVWTQARERWDEALAAESWEGMPAEAVVEGVVGLLLRSFRADYHRRRVLGGDTPADPEAAAQRLSFHRHILDTVTPLLLARRAELTHPAPEKAIQFGYRFVVGAIREFMEMEEGAEALAGAGMREGGLEEARAGAGQGEEGAGVPASSELGQELARVWMGYLAPGREAERAEEEATVDFFDPWG